MCIFVAYTHCTYSWMFSDKGKQTDQIAGCSDLADHTVLEYSVADICIISVFYNILSMLYEKYINYKYTLIKLEQLQWNI